MTNECPLMIMILNMAMTNDYWAPGYDYDSDYDYD